MQMKQVLFLDDDHRRIAEFRKRTASLPCEVVVVETADAAAFRAAGHDVSGPERDA
jgi:hypothetical protein